MKVENVSMSLTDEKREHVDYCFRGFFFFLIGLVELLSELDELSPKSLLIVSFEPELSKLSRPSAKLWVLL
jgi:hypothetical protein